MLILNHIGYSYFNYFDGDVEHVRKLLETNFLSYVAMTVTALPMLKESEGSIVVVSSVAGEYTRGQALRASSLPLPAAGMRAVRQSHPDGSPVSAPGLHPECTIQVLWAFTAPALRDPVSQYRSYLKGKRRGEPCRFVPAQHT